MVYFTSITHTYVPSVIYTYNPNPSNIGQTKSVFGVELSPVKHEDEGVFPHVGRFDQVYEGGGGEVCVVISHSLRTYKNRTVTLK